MAEVLSSVSIDRFSAECTSTRHKTGNYNGIAVFIKFLECESLTLSKDDIIELKLVRHTLPPTWWFLKQAVSLQYNTIQCVVSLVLSLQRKRNG